MKRLGLASFRAGLRLLPAWLRREAGDDMVALFRARQDEATTMRALLAVWWIEFVGLARTAVLSRRPGRRSEPRTTPGMTMDRIATDLRFAFRTLKKRPLHAALATLTLGLGIAASTAMFSVVDAVLWSDSPFPEPDRLVSVYPTNPDLRGHVTLGDAAERGTFSDPEVRALRDVSTELFEGLSLFTSDSYVLTSSDGPATTVAGARVYAGIFSDVARVSPIMGRTFTAEDESDQAAVVVVTESFWDRHFGRDPDVIGKLLTFGQTSYEVIGVVSDEALLTESDVEVFRLYRPDEVWGRHSFWAVARLRPGVTLEQAKATLTPAFRESVPPEHQHHAINVFRRHEDSTRKVRGPLLLLLGSSLVLLLVACGNVAVLLLGAAIDREAELSVRGALGADRRRLFQQLLTESVVLAAAGAAVGVLLAHLATSGLTMLAPPGVPRVEDAAVNLRALTAGIGIAAACGLLFGLAPAFLFSDANLARAMGTRGAGRRGKGSVQGLVVVGELALATVLLVGAGLLGRTVLALNRVDTGFPVERLVHVDLQFYASQVAETAEDGSVDSGSLDEFYQAMQREVESLPGVAGAAFTTNIPLGASRGNNTILPEGYEGDEIVAARRFVSANYFEVSGTEILEGRPFDTYDDSPGAPSRMVISQGVAERAWPGESAIGKTVRYWGRDSEVVGVAENVSGEFLDQPTVFEFYVPRRQAEWWGADLLVRTDGDPALLTNTLRERVAAISPNIAIRRIIPLTENVADQVASERFRARLVVVFSVLASIFALMGIYGVTARSVAARTREMGIRLALGAPRATVGGIILKQAFRFALYGGILGLVGAFLTGRVIERFLWGVEPTDGLVLIGTAAAISAASVIAALAPARRAAKVDPMDALNAD